MTYLVVINCNAFHPILLPHNPNDPECPNAECSNVIWLCSSFIYGRN